MSPIHSDQYFKILGLEPDATLDQIKKAYREKARIYHPDINKRPEAADIFIAVNEAYEFLTQKARNLSSRIHQEEMQKAWHAYKREEARKRAKESARERYEKFIQSDVYKTSVVLNKTQLYINLSVSVFIISMAITGYAIKWEDVGKGSDPPSLLSFIFLLVIGLTFFFVSLAHTLAFYKKKRKIDAYERKNK